MCRHFLLWWCEAKEGEEEGNAREREKVGREGQNTNYFSLPEGHEKVLLFTRGITRGMIIKTSTREAERDNTRRKSGAGMERKTRREMMKISR